MVGEIAAQSKCIFVSKYFDQIVSFLTNGPKTIISISHTVRFATLYFAKWSQSQLLSNLIAKTSFFDRHTINHSVPRNLTRIRLWYDITINTWNTKSLKSKVFLFNQPFQIDRNRAMAPIFFARLVYLCHIHMSYHTAYHTHTDTTWIMGIHYTCMHVS